MQVNIIQRGRSVSQRIRLWEFIWVELIPWLEWHQQILLHQKVAYVAHYNIRLPRWTWFPTFLFGWCRHKELHRVGSVLLNSICKKKVCQQSLTKFDKKIRAYVDRRWKLRKCFHKLKCATKNVLNDQILKIIKISQNLLSNHLV